MLRFLVALLSLASFGQCFPDNDINGIAFVAITTADLEGSVKFYADTMGGMHITEWSRKDVQSDDQWYRMFGKEILDARDMGVLPEQIGVPQIRLGGSHTMNWEWVLHDNTLFWLRQFNDKSGNPLNYEQQDLGTAKTGYGHMAFWCQKDAQPYQMLQDIMREQLAAKNPYAGFAALDDMTSVNQRNTYFNTNLDRFMYYMGGKGMVVAAARGPSGEKIELSWYREYNTLEFQDFCNVTAVHSAMLPYYSWRSNRYEKPNIKTNGLHHVSLTVENLTIGNEFYTKTIGGKSPQVTALGMKTGPELNNFLFQDDLLVAAEKNRKPDAQFGYIDIAGGDPTSGSVDMSFTNMDNFYFEMYQFNPGNPSDKALLEKRFTSTGYTGIVLPGFWVKDSVKLSDYIKRVEREAQAKKWDKVLCNRAVATGQVRSSVNDADYSREDQSGTLQGFDYTFCKGPSGEPFAVAKFSGAAGRLLKNKILEYGGVSTAFKETNPWTYGEYNGICAKLLGAGQDDTKDESRGGSRGLNCVWLMGRNWRMFWSCMRGRQ